MAQSEKFATYDKNLCRLCGNTTNTNQRLAIFSDYGNTINLQRLISDFAKVRVQEDDCFPNHLCRSCYRTLLNLRDKLLAFKRDVPLRRLILRRKSQANSELTKIKPFCLALWCAKAEKESHSNARFVQESVIP